MAPSSERHEANDPWSTGAPIRIQLGSSAHIDILNVQATPPGPRGVHARLHNPRNHVCACLSECWCKRSRLGYAVRWYTPARWHRLPPPPASGEPKARPPR